MALRAAISSMVGGGQETEELRELVAVQAAALEELKSQLLEASRPGLLGRAAGWVRQLDWRDVALLAGGVLGVVHVARKARDWWKPGEKLEVIRVDQSLLAGEKTYKHRNEPESLKDGSPLEDTSKGAMPKFMGILASEVDGSLTLLGNCVRIADWVVFPSHVMKDDQVLILPKDPDRLEKGKRILLMREALVELDTDLVGAKLKEEQFSLVGLAKPNLGMVAPESSAMAVAFAAVIGKSAHGAVRCCREFGKVIFLGSTVKGFSGGAYTRGPSLLGVHLHGGPENAGYAASYIYARIRQIEKQSQEDSDEWFRKTISAMVKKGKKPQLQRSPGDPMEWMFLDQSGRYHTLDQATIEAAGFDTGSMTLLDEDGDVVEESLAQSSGNEVRETGKSGASPASLTNQGSMEAEANLATLFASAKSRKQLNRLVLLLGSKDFSSRLDSMTAPQAASSQA